MEINVNILEFFVGCVLDLLKKYISNLFPYFHAYRSQSLWILLRVCM